MMLLMMKDSQQRCPLPGGLQSAGAGRPTCALVTRVAQAVTAGHGGSARKGPRGPQVDWPAGARGGELVSPVRKCRRCRCRPRAARQGRPASGRPRGRRAEPQRAEEGTGRTGPLPTHVSSLSLPPVTSALSPFEWHGCAGACSRELRALVLCVQLC